MMALDIEKYKKILEGEQEKLIQELKTVGRINPTNPEDWEATPGESNIDTADKNDRGDVIEAFEENSAILKELETRLHNVKRALSKIEKGTYGICEVSGEPIEEKRLDANPSARTNIANRDATLN